MFCSLFFYYLFYFSNEAADMVTKERIPGKNKDTRQIFFTQECLSHNRHALSPYFTQQLRREVCVVRAAKVITASPHNVHEFDSCNLPL